MMAVLSVCLLCNLYITETLMGTVLSALSLFFFFSSRRRHTRYIGDWSSDVCSSDLSPGVAPRRWSGRTRGLAIRARGPGHRTRSEERRVGKEGRSRGGQDQ